MRQRKENRRTMQVETWPDLNTPTRTYTAPTWTLPPRTTSSYRLENTMVINHGAMVKLDVVHRLRIRVQRRAFVSQPLAFPPRLEQAQGPVNESR